MKKFNIKALVAIAALAGLSTSCSDILDETPRSKFTLAYFQTAQGVEGGLTSLYATLRNLYGEPYVYNDWQCGTDEYTFGQSADGNMTDIDFTIEDESTGKLFGSTLTGANTTGGILWGRSFPAINTASGVIEYAEPAGVSPALVSEARFFRAFYYFNLVQEFGGVPLDLGSGVMKFNSDPKRTSVRNTVPEVYTIGIFPDLVKAVDELPDDPRVVGGVTKTMARLTLAKAYLTYGWWLENPNNIPTYPVCDRVDPDGHDAAWYFQKAYDLAIEAIENPGPFGLQESFYKVNVEENSRNNEWLLFSDRTKDNEEYNGTNYNYAGDINAAQNYAWWFTNFNYTEVKSGKSLDGGNWKGSVSSVQRSADQYYGRPWTRIAPPHEVFNNIFAEKVKDSRYDGTFNTVYRANWKLNDADAKVDSVFNANKMVVRNGEPIFKFLSENNDAIDYTNNKINNIGMGEIPGEAAWVVDIQGINRRAYPANWKLGASSPDKTDSNLGTPNAALARPYCIAKFSELYLIAAEAAVKGATGSQSARDLINVLRARAGKWTYSNADRAEKIADYSADMVAATPATIDINYVLDERSRELFGEGYRRFDLIRTQTWIERAGEYTICGVLSCQYDDHTPRVWKRDIKDYMYLRPIPQSQFDNMDCTEEEKAAYQNPGY
ncbi:MAG: RagB/SusD family nutrient uptake outer membrane protein [Salinivirgaceae bacterium]|nr:RagB/SusD family nutrient uptake outer membrane protein [Salinivirgaceae bacterium]